MTNSLVTFNFKDNQVRTEIVDGELWFSLLDCCKALGIKNAATSVKLPEAGVGKTYCSYESGRKEITIINEPNLYRLIFRSNKPQAQSFAYWVYSEVLPSIRKTGGYGVPSLTNDRAALKAIGGIVKKCAAVAVREELAALLSGDPQADWELSDQQLMYDLYRWNATKNRENVVKFRELNSRCESLAAENAGLKIKLEKIKQTLN